MMELIDAVGRYGLPTVAAGLILWLYIRAQQRQDERMDRWETRLLGDGNGTRGAITRIEDRLDQIQRSTEVRREECAARIARIEQSVADLGDLVLSRPCLADATCEAEPGD